MARVLIVDDEAPQRAIMRSILEAEEHTLFEADGVDTAVSLFGNEQIDVVLSDLKMQGKSGIDLVESIGRMELGPEVVVITAFGTIETAVRAMRLGAYDYLTKPIEHDELVMVVRRAAQKYSLRLGARQWQREAIRLANEGIIAESPAMKQVIEAARKVAQSDATVLLSGESGTGKERIARLIHSLGPRGNKPLLCINCAAFPESLLESELFGYEKGAFTGAQSRKAGILEAADGSTVLLDEVADMSLPTQAKILRALQQKEIRRVGGTAPMSIDVRFIAATNKNLHECVANGTFREDLYYRLNIIPIVLPPLRERPEDIEPLLTAVLGRRSPKKSISRQAMGLFKAYRWPGNVRELEAVMERMAILAPGNEMTVEDLPEEIRSPNADLPLVSSTLPEEGIVFEEWERSMLQQALRRANGVMTEAARLLGMTYRTFQYRAEKFGLGQPK